MARILIVDDDPAARQLGQALLAPFGHQVGEAGDGSEGLELARRNPPDLIISDILMPTMNGYEFVSAVRRIPRLEKIPVIFSSASFLDREASALGASCGVTDYILKPADPEKFLKKVHGVLGLSATPALSVPAPPRREVEAIPLLVDAVYTRAKQVDALTARLGALLELAVNLAGRQSVDGILAQAAAAARKILGANYAAAALFEARGPRLEAFALSGVDARLASEIDPSSFGGDVFRQLLSCREPRSAFDPSGLRHGLELPRCHPLVHSFVGTPLTIGGQVQGWVYAAEKLASLEFDDEDSRILTALAAQTALACENARRYRAIQEHSAELEAEMAHRRQAEERFCTLVETTPTGIVLVDEKGNIAEANAHSLKLFGYERSEIVGRPVETLLPEALRSAHREHRASFSLSLHSRPMGLGMEILARRKDGSEFPVEISLAPLVSQGETLVSAVIVDISGRKKLEAQLQTSQRMEAIGRLAGGVAHDFNNLLTVIIGSCEAALLDLPAGHPAAARLERASEAGSCAADLTRQLFAFGRKQILQPQVMDPRRVVAGMEKVLGRLVGEHIQVTVALDAAAGCIHADPGQIEQVLLNLAANARDAMPDGGLLAIRVANTDFDEASRRLHPDVAPGSYVMIEVADTGCGIDPKIQSQIFDPFFTTKDVGKGTGLGLATVYGVVKQSGGCISVDSEVGKGSVFKIYLPRVDAAATTPRGTPPDDAPPRGAETILLAEDSEALRDIAREYLEGLGYSVIEACSGAEALQRAEQFDGVIHLLLTDVVMPHVGGRELADRIARLRPGIKVLFSSGHADDAIVRQGVLEPNIAFIQKPYRPRALAHKVREVLENDRPWPAVPSPAA